MIYYIPLPGCLRFEKMDVEGAEQLTLTRWRIDERYRERVDYELNINNIQFTRGLAK